jgi:tRNA A37 methylthiotransferase MiaB
MYPDILTIENIDKFKLLKKFIPYWDIPFQHINADLLKKM